MSEIKKEIHDLLNEVERYLMQQEELFGGVLYPTAKVQQLKTEWSDLKTLNELNSKICNCLKCTLGHTRTNFVFGVGI